MYVSLGAPFLTSHVGCKFGLLSATNSFLHVRFKTFCFGVCVKEACLHFFYRYRLAVAARPTAITLHSSLATTYAHCPPTSSVTYSTPNPLLCPRKSSATLRPASRGHTMRHSVMPPPSSASSQFFLKSHLQFLHGWCWMQNPFVLFILLTSSHIAVCFFKFFFQKIC